MTSEVINEDFICCTGECPGRVLDLIRAKIPEGDLEGRPLNYKFLFVVDVSGKK
jgi:hypothetical protein